ncbi:AAA family ATPase [Niallia sp. XMNu-256]|uniref:ATP-binding protein n=1 Tax=Niallia sp. XMNu-256 TaxID=3082444 RepID=UPI0030D0798D
MKIEEIHIYGYGKFENTRYTNLGNKQIFFGSNEAGKSTIMSFVHSILFGFPTKQQSELRYEPKKGAKYGGQLIVYFPDHGRVVIERVKGKATGDVIVKLESGRIGGEDLLGELLSSIDKQLYTSIFSFNLHGLQNIHLVKEQDLGKFLFSIGTVGTDQLLKAENKLSKELESRFKYNGRNPLLNIKIKELQQLRGELRKAERNNEQYVSLLKKREELQAEIQQLKASATGLSRNQAKWEEWKKTLPLYKRREVLENELAQYDRITFPEQGLEKLDQLTGLQNRVQRKLHTTEQRLQRLKVELDQLTPNFTLIEKEHEINAAVESLPLIDRTKQEINGLQIKIKKLDEELQLLHNKVHLPLSQQDIINSNTSIFIKEKVANLAAKQKSLTAKKLELDERFQEEKNRLEELESKEIQLKEELVSDEEKNKMEEALSRWKAKETILFQIEYLEERLTGLHSSIQKEKNRKAQHKVQHLILAILFSALSAWGLLSEAFTFLFLGGLGLLFIFWSFFKASFSKDIESMQKESTTLQEKKAILEQELNMPSNQIEGIRQRFERDQGIRDQVNQLSLMIERQQDQYNHVVDLFEQWEHNEAGLRQELLRVGKELKLPDNIALHHLLDAFQMIDELKKVTLEKDLIVKEIVTTENSMKEMVAAIEELSFLLSQKAPSYHEAVFMLKRSLREELEKHIQYKEKQEQYRELEGEWNNDRIEWKGLQAEIDLLYQKAGVQDEKDFREKARIAGIKDNLLQQWNQVNIQLKLSTIDITDIDSFEEQTIDERIEEIQVEKQALEQRITHFNEELASVRHQISLIEEGGTYADLLHRYKQQKSEFQSEALEWAKFAAAKEILQRTINNFKELWFPKMLVKAEEFLQFLTGGNYIRILPKQDSSGFIIESKDHLLFEANELSQATTEQIYISIRLALALTVYEKFKFPIIIDDSFVNFDRVRTHRVIQLLTNLDDYQVLFFTCHEHLLSHFQSENIIKIEKENAVS